MCAKVCGPDQPSEPRLNRQLQLFPERNRRSPGVENVGGVLAPSANAGGPPRTAVGTDESSGGEVRSLVTEPRCPVFPANLCYGKRQPAVRPTPGRWLDHNVDIPAQPGQAFQQTVLRNPAKPPLQEGGDFGLR